MTHPTTAMEAWQAARKAWHTPKPELLNTDGSYSIGNSEAAAAVLEAWKEEQVRELRDMLDEAQAREARLREALKRGNGAYQVSLADQDAARREAKELREENEVLKSLVRGWHYLAVGPDEMGDYYMQKQLIKASEPYALRALLAGERGA